MGKKNNNGGGIFIRNTINENYFHNVAFENLKGNSNNFLFDKNERHRWLSSGIDATPNSTNF